MMIRRFFQASVLALSVLSVASIVDAKYTKTGTARVEFSATGPAGMAIKGRTNDLVVEDGGDITIRVPLQNLTTGLALRDKHMKEKHLEVGKYPEAVLKVPRASLQLPAENGTKEGNVQGSLSLHGVTKSVPFRFKVVRNGQHVNVDGGFRINITDFKIEVPSYMGVTVKPNVDVSAGFAVQDQ